MNSSLSTQLVTRGRRPWPLAVWAFCLLCVGATAAWASAGPSATPSATKLYNVSDRAWESFQAADKALQAGRSEAAERGFLEAAEIAPLWGLPNGRLAVMYHLQGCTDRAMEQYQAVQAASVGGWHAEGLTEEQQKLREEIIRQEAYATYLVNNARRGVGLNMLYPDPLVAMVARAHSVEMRDCNYFSHDSPTPGRCNVQERFVWSFGYKPRCVGENLARRWGTNFLLTSEKILATHNDLMASHGHRENILYPTMQWIGVGLAATAKGDYWITEVFVEPGDHAPR
jgi:uncharacterized protein YkwD